MESVSLPLVESGWPSLCDLPQDDADMMLLVYPQEATDDSLPWNPGQSPWEEA